MNSFIPWSCKVSPLHTYEKGDFVIHFAGTGSRGIALPFFWERFWSSLSKNQLIRMVGYDNAVKWNNETYYPGSKAWVHHIPNDPKQKATTTSSTTNTKKDQQK